MQNNQTLIDAIIEADTYGNLNIIFEKIPENDIWEYTNELLTDDAFNQDFSPTLFRAVSQNFGKLKNKEVAVNLIRYALTVLKDGIAYEAVQKVILQNVAIYDQTALLMAYRVFHARYRDEVISGDKFIAAKSLEGAIMTAILSGDQGLFFSAIALLLTEFPPIPTTKDDSGLLPILALRLLGRCYDLHPNNVALANKNADFLFVNNIATKTEAQFTAGIVQLSDAFSSPHQDTLLLEKLKSARDYFQLAYHTEENRTDAELYIAICDCFLSVWENNQTASKKEQNIERATKILVERLLMLGKGSLSYSNNLEISIVKILSMLESWNELLIQNRPELSDIKSAMSTFAKFYYSLRNLELLGSLAKNIRDVSINSIVLPQIQNSFMNIQDIRERIASVLNDPYWRSAAPTAEISFYEIALKTIDGFSPPKASAAIQVRPLIEAAAQYRPEVAHFIQKSYSEGKDITEILMNVFDDSPNLKSSEAPIQKILENLTSSLPKTFSDEYLKVRYLGLAIRYIVNYASNLFNAKREDEFLFLFNEPPGLGKKATEGNLESHFYKVMRFQPNIKIEHQPQTIAPGRPDLCIRFPGEIIFPIEVKREDKDISKENINQKYLAQAQTYASAQSGIGFLFVLDVTDKQFGTPARNFRENFYLDYKVVPNSSYQDCVIVVIFPANRFSPSDHSWKGHGKSITS
jgi:hypothetical protein